MVKDPKVLFLDIETSFKIAGVWDRWNVNIAMNQLLQDTHVLCWAAKWLGEKMIYADALHYHKSAYKADPTNDKAILKTVWKMLNEADFVVAHNGARFDVPVLNGRFVLQGLKPPTPYTVIDTLQVARRQFKFTSNRLDDIAKSLDLGAKLKTDFDLWKDVVVKRNIRAFNRMVAYNKQDVRLLEAVYHKLKIWDKQHPAIYKHLVRDVAVCNACGSTNIHRRGFYHTPVNTYRVYRCVDCLHCMRSRIAEKNTNSKNILRSV